MPRFTFQKHSECEHDPEVIIKVSSDQLETIRECFEDFLSGSGFVLPSNVESMVVKDETNVIKHPMWDDN